MRSAGIACLVLGAAFAVSTTACTSQPDGPPEPFCGDGICNEAAGTCHADCVPDVDAAPPPPPPVCGDRVCDTNETSTCPSDCTATLVTHNSTSPTPPNHTVGHLYVWMCGATSRGPDQLAGRTIVPAASFTLTGIPPGCWNLHADATDGSYWERTSQQFYTGQTFTWNLGL